MNESQPGPLNPPIVRTSMAYRRLSSQRRGPVDWRWRGIVFVRRFVFLSLVAASAFFGGKTIALILSPGEESKLNVWIVSIFTVLFTWIAANFWTVLLGFL